MPKTKVEFDLNKKVRTIALVPITGIEGRKHVPNWFSTYIYNCQKSIPKVRIQPEQSELIPDGISLNWINFMDFWPATAKRWQAASTSYICRSFSSLLFYTIIFMNDKFYYVIFNTYIEELLQLTSKSGPFTTDSTAFMFQDFKQGKIISKNDYIVFNKGSTYNGAAHLNGKRIEIPARVFQTVFRDAFKKLPEVTDVHGLNKSCNPDSYAKVIWKGKLALRRQLYSSK